jgi:glutamyl-Q tRNA(Asp) synthetase
VPDKRLYIGRFAPSPTGSLHRGSLYTALASFLDARAQQGRWLLRIDDLDTPRNISGSADTILKTLDIFGLHWDGSVVYQSQHSALYHDHLNNLAKNQLLYPCICSRKTLSSAAATDIYPGFCRNTLISPDSAAYALRLKTDDRLITFYDELQGEIAHNLARQHGDFIVKRKDQIIAYQFAVVIDDAEQGVNHVVRGFDLLDSTPKQIYLQQRLGLRTPNYLHVPIIVDEHGYKLSKQTRATAVDLTAPAKVVFELLQLLKQAPPAALQHAPLTELLAWAIAHWQPLLLKNTQLIR